MCCSVLYSFRSLARFALLVLICVQGLLMSRHKISVVVSVLDIMDMRLVVHILSTEAARAVLARVRLLLRVWGKLMLAGVDKLGKVSSWRRSEARHAHTHIGTSLRADPASAVHNRCNECRPEALPMLKFTE